MFQTLKARRGVTGDSEYVVQSASPPFDKNKARKQQACTLCKLKKWRCVAEADSCVKCLKQGLECSYRGTTVTDATSDPSLSTGTSESESQILQPTHNPCDTAKDSDTSITVHDEASFSDWYPMPALAHMNNCFDFTGLSNDSSYSYTSNNNPEEISVTPIISLQNTPSIVTDSGSWEPNLTQETQTTSLVQSSMATSQGEISCIDASGAETSETTSAQPLRTACCCLDQIMSANEIMQVKLIWAASSHSGPTISVDDMLKCQKDILASCEKLLECSRCSLRSDYVMLIVSMCHGMMRGIRDLDAITLSGSQNENSERSRSNASGGKLIRTKKSLNAGGWRFDDKEEMDVIRSLIGIRITRLGSLIGQLEKTVNTYHSAYQWIINDLRQGITEKTDAIESEGDGVVVTNQ